MVVDDVMCSHIVWKLRMRQALEEGQGVQMDPATVRRDDLCELGKWLYGEGAQYADVAEYRAVKESHAILHRKVAEAIESLGRGERAVAVAIMDTPVEAASRDIVHGLALLRTKLSTGAK